MLASIACEVRSLSKLFSISHEKTAVVGFVLKVSLSPLGLVWVYFNKDCSSLR